MVAIYSRRRGNRFEIGSKDKLRLDADKYIVVALIIVNLAAGFGCAIPMAGKLSPRAYRPRAKSDGGQP